MNREEYVVLSKTWLQWMNENGQDPTRAYLAKIHALEALLRPAGSTGWRGSLAQVVMDIPLPERNDNYQSGFVDAKQAILQALREAGFDKSVASAAAPADAGAGLTEKELRTKFVTRVGATDEELVRAWMMSHGYGNQTVVYALVDLQSRIDAKDRELREVLARLPTPAAPVTSIDTPEFQRLLEEVAYEISCNQPDKAKYDAARTALLNYISQSTAPVTTEPVATPDLSASSLLKLWDRANAAATDAMPALFQFAKLLLANVTHAPVTADPVVHDFAPLLGIHNDRDMLNYLTAAFDNEVNTCERCGHSEPTKNMDSASFLRDYLAAAPVPPQSAASLPATSSEASTSEGEGA